MKLYAYIAAAAVLAGILGYGVHVVRKANRVDVAEARADAAEQRALAVAEAAVKAAAQDRKIDNALDIFRNESGAQTLAFNQALKSKPLVNEVTRVDPKTGVSNTCSERDADTFRRLFNQAVTGTPGS